MPEWLVALVILVAVCAIGVYYVNGFHGLVPEGFFDRRADQQKCDSDYQACLKTATNATCTAAYNTCNASAFSSPSPSAKVPEASQSGSSAVAALANASAEMRGNSATHAKLSQESMGVTSSSASPPAPLSLDPKAQSVLGSINKIPTDQQLSLAQGQEEESQAQEPGSPYNPGPQIIRPDGFPRTPQPQLTAIAASDAGTQAEQIRTSSPPTASLREMIRDDIKNTIKDELNNVDHPYSINYEKEKAGP